MINASTSLVGLIGWPIEHSLSPLMHNAAFRSLGLNWRYLPLPVRPDKLEHAINGLRALNFIGCNVTIPYKESALKYLDDVVEVAEWLGAINTIQVKEGRLIGSNTDPDGFRSAMREDGIKVSGKEVMILGAGGAARAVLLALAKAGAYSVAVVNRTPGKAERLVQEMARFFPRGILTPQPMVEESFRTISSNVYLIINTTPVGMFPVTNASPWPDSVEMPGEAIYYDLVYNPEETAFLVRAKAAGAKTVNGLGMLVHQGALSFKYWTGQPAPIEIMRQSCREYLTRAGKIEAGKQAGRDLTPNMSTID